MAYRVNNHEPANSIIESLGGAKNTAKLLRLSHNTPTYWRSAIQQQADGRMRGTGGYIPFRYWNRIIALGKERGLEFEIVIDDLRDIGPYLKLKNSNNK